MPFSSTFGLIPSHFGSIKLFSFHGPNYTLAKFQHGFLFFQDIFLPDFEGFHMTAKKGETMVKSVWIFSNGKIFLLNIAEEQKDTLYHV